MTKYATLKQRKTEENLAFILIHHDLQLQTSIKKQNKK